VSFLFMTTVFIWPLDLWSADHKVSIAYLFFFAGAILWAPFSLLSVERESKMLVVFAMLLVVSLSTISLFVLSLTLDSSLPWKTPTVISSFIVMFHHTFLDAIWWWLAWTRRDLPVL